MLNIGWPDRRTIFAVLHKSMAQLILTPEEGLPNVISSLKVNGGRLVQSGQ